MALELRMEPLQAPEEIRFNYEELKTRLAGMVAEYKGLVFTEEQLPEAKKDRASLNRMKKALNDARIGTQKEYMVPFDEFKGRIDELIRMVDEPIREIDEQVKAFEEAQKQEKKEEILRLFAEKGFQRFVTPEKIWNEKWLNKSCSMKQIDEEMNALINKIGTEVYTIHQLEAFSFEAMEIYKESLDLNKAIAEGKRLSNIQKRKEEEAKAKQQAETVMEPAAEKAEEAESQTIESSHEKAHWQEKSVTFRITASYEQKELINALFRELKEAGVRYEILGSEER